MENNTFLVWSLKPSVPIYKHWWFWIAVLFPLFVALGFAVPIIPWDKPCFTSGCYSTFVSEFSFPLSIMSFSILFGVFVARLHFSLQRAESILQTEKHDNFKIYFEHKEYVKKIFEEYTFYITDRTPKNKSEIKKLLEEGKKILKVSVSFQDFYKLLFPHNNLNEIESWPSNESICSQLSSLSCIDVFVHSDKSGYIRFLDSMFVVENYTESYFIKGEGRSIDAAEELLINMADQMLFHLFMEFRDILSNKTEPYSQESMEHLMKHMSWRSEQNKYNENNNLIFDMLREKVTV